MLDTCHRVDFKAKTIMLVQVVVVKTIEISESINVCFVAMAPHQMNIYTLHP